MLPRFFIHRPVFAWVMAICIMAFGAIAVTQLPVEQYPDIAPPQVLSPRTTPAPRRQTVEDSVTQVIEQQIKGIDHLLYFSSTSSSSGSGAHHGHLRPERQPRYRPGAGAEQRQSGDQPAAAGAAAGRDGRKVAGDSLMVVSLYDTSRRMERVDVPISWSAMQDPISRIPGVGEINVFGSAYAMRMWLDPHKLRAYDLMPSTSLRSRRRTPR
jgi:multidrug efflux pump